MLENIALITLAAILSAAPIVLIKRYIDKEEKNALLFISALLCSFILLFVYIKLLKKNDVAPIYTIIKIISILIVTVIGYLILKEKITKKQMIGVFFGVVALILLF